MDDSKKTKEQLLTENILLNEQLAELKRSNESLKIIFDLAPDAVFIIDLNGIFLNINNVLAEVIGLDKNKIIGENMKSGTPEVALYGFAVFYAICAILNWWYYLGPKAEYKNP